MAKGTSQVRLIQDFETGGYPGLPSRASHKGPDGREAGEPNGETVATTHGGRRKTLQGSSETGEGDPEPQNGDGPRDQKRQGNVFSPGVSRRNTTLPTILDC